MPADKHPTARAHLVQLDIRWEDKPANYARTRELLARAQVLPGDLIVLPEMFDTGFSVNLSATADHDGATLTFIQSLAREHQATVHGARTVIGPDARGRNRVSVADPRGQIICEYDKVHPFTLGKEAEHFSSGEVVTTYPWLLADGSPMATVCPAICYDLRFPELFRMGLVQGAQVYAVGSSWPASRELARRTLSIARAIENQAYVFSVNRCGRDPNLEYAGGTLAVAPNGDVIAELGREEAVLTVDVPMQALHSWRRTFPAWKDHRLLPG